MGRFWALHKTVSPLWDAQKWTKITVRSAQGLFRVEVNEEGPRLPWAGPSLHVLCTPESHRSHTRHRHSSVQGKALLDVLLKGQIPEQQLRPCPQGCHSPQTPERQVQGPHTTTHPLQSPQEKAHKTDSDSVLPLFPPWFSFTAAPVCLRWPGVKKALLLWWNMWEQVRPWLQRAQQMATSSSCSYWQGFHC